MLSDWQRPKSHQGKWKSKVRWDLLNEYDVRGLERSQFDIPEADLEVQSRMQSKALFNKYSHKKHDAGATKSGANPE